MQIGPHLLDNPVILAPMAGVTDLPFRKLCMKFGAAIAISEMLTADPSLWNTNKSLKRMDHTDELGVRWVQIAGSDPQMLAQAAQFNEKRGAQIIDINMGCPAKKVCLKAAGSALLSDPQKVQAILEKVSEAVKIPVTLKIRTGPDLTNRNAEQIAQIAQDAGIKALSIHGRTRACRFEGTAEYDTIAKVKKLVQIPVIANGDITSPEQAKKILDFTAADAIMIGRAAQGRPWIFREINHYLQTGEILPLPELSQIGQILLEHVKALHQFYGELSGLRIARKHVGWYLKNHPQGAEIRTSFNKINCPVNQLDFLYQNFNRNKLANAS